MQVNESSSLEEIQSLLLRGKREDAVRCALTGNQYALALLIASVCDQSIYHAVARAFVDKALPLGTPLHTVTSLFANQTQPIVTDDGKSSFWMSSTQNLGKTWRYHLASILSNQTQGWKKIVIALGDHLLLQGKCHAAHFCFLVSGCPIATSQDRSSRLVLIGCDHNLERNLVLATNDSLEGYERTEALEWAKRKGNPNAVISTLQPFKLKYASMLADYGLHKVSKAYVDNIRKCTGIRNTNNYVSSDPRPPYSTEFVEALNILDDRLCVLMGLPNEFQDMNSKKAISLPSVLSKFVGSGTTQKEKSELDPADIIDVADESHFDDDANISFVSATSNLLDITAKSHQHTNRQTKEHDNKFVPQLSSFNEPVSKTDATKENLTTSKSTDGQSSASFPSYKGTVPTKPSIDTPSRNMPSSKSKSDNPNPKEFPSYKGPTGQTTSTETGVATKNPLDEAPNSAPVKQLSNNNAASTPASAPFTTPVRKDNDKEKEEAPPSSGKR